MLALVTINANQKATMTTSNDETFPNDQSDRQPHSEPDLHPDAITGEPGSHPVGTGIGSASGAATGALIGMLGGPLGAGIGGVAGAIVGGLIGKGIGEAVDPTEDAYWRETHQTRDYYDDRYSYDDYEPAYRLGYTLADSEHEHREHVETISREAHTYDDADAELERLYGDRRGESNLDFNEARPAIRDAYDRRVQQRVAQTSS